MFFPERIKNIRHTDIVLEIGPGGSPHPRSDVFLEMIYKDKVSAEAQRGFAPELKTKKKIIYYDGGIFPFKDKEFDYVICSHVIEHVPDAESFLKEMFRVAQKGYLEYPLIYYDYIYDFPEHLTFFKLHERTLFYLPKNETPLSKFSTVNKFFYESLKAGHVCLISALENKLFEGFEWTEPFKIQKTNEISNVCWKNIKIDPFINNRLFLLSNIKALLRTLLSWTITGKQNLSNLRN